MSLFMKLPFFFSNTVARVRRGLGLRSAEPEILRDRGLDQGRERLSIEHLSLPDVDGATRVSLEAGVEEPPRVLQGGTPGEGQLDHLFVGLSRADVPSVGTDV